MATRNGTTTYPGDTIPDSLKGPHYESYMNEDPPTLTQRDLEEVEEWGRELDTELEAQQKRAAIRAKFERP